MTQYVLQVQVSDNGQHVGWLAKCYEVSEKSPIRETWPASRIQIVTENGEAFSEIVAAYNQYKTEVFFSYDEPTRTVSCTGAVIGSWVL